MAIIKNYTPSRKKYISTDNTQSKLQLMIGGNIFHWRKYRGLSQEELATKAAITQSIVSELENGDYNPSVEILQKIAHALEIEYELLNKQSMNWKMIECIDYLTQKIQDITTLKAMKLLYMIDYESLQQKKEKMTGLEYIRYMW